MVSNRSGLSLDKTKDQKGYQFRASKLLKSLWSAPNPKSKPNNLQSSEEYSRIITYSDSTLSDPRQKHIIQHPGTIAVSVRALLTLLTWLWFGPVFEVRNCRATWTLQKILGVYVIINSCVGFRWGILHVHTFSGYILCRIGRIIHKEFPCEVKLWERLCPNIYGTNMEK